VLICPICGKTPHLKYLCDQSDNYLSYRKFQPTQLFTGTELLGPDAVLITDEQGKVAEIVSAKNAGEGVQQLDGLLSPGFINCHCHLELSHMRSLVPEQTGLVDFVFKVVNERHFPEDEILDAIAKAEDEMLANGIVAVGDICNNTITLQQKHKQRLAYYNFIEVSGWMPSVAQVRFERSLGVYDAFEKMQNAEGKTQNAISPHAPYSVSNELWALMDSLFKQKTVTIHNQETDFEDLLFQKKEGDFMRMYGLMNMDTSFFKPTGKSSLQSYFSKMSNAKRVLLVHNTFTKEADVLFVNRESSVVSWCVCINANQYIENAVPPIDLLRKNNCHIVVGTDSLASNWSLNILDELKTITKHFPSVPLEELLQWATLNGARALQMDDQLGSFEKGKKPGVVLISGLENNQFTQSSISKRLI
jgi:cytosine/adenosine deaminase-related metal-dependent hydrolase